MIDFQAHAAIFQSSLVVSIDDYTKGQIADLLAKREGMIRVRLDAPGRAKTSPENRLFHALVAQLAMYRETSPDLLKRYIKVRGCAYGYPYEAFDDGAGRKSVEPKSVADATAIELAILIETCHIVAHEWQFELKGVE